MRALQVIRPGLLTTVQDLGRWGLQNRGMPVAGPMDVWSHRAANRLVGNDPAAAALEITLVGPELEATREVVCAVAGAEFEIDVAGRRVALHAPFTMAAGQRIRFGSRRRGARATLAVAGGIETPPVFGSRATSLSAGIGGMKGRALRAGDVLPVGIAAGRPADRRIARLALPEGEASIRVLPGPHVERFDRRALGVLTSGRFVLSHESNRMGYRLSGPEITARPGQDLPSDATPMGSIQVLPSGQLILLMADRQTAGGYPRIATVISADLPIAGQLAPGDGLSFALTSRDAALEALRAREAALEVWR